MAPRKGQRTGNISQLKLLKSVQNYEITIPAASNSATQALGTAVNKAHAYAYFNGVRKSNSSAFSAAEDETAVELTNGSTVTVKTNSASTVSADRIVSVQVVEFWPWAAQVQHGVMNIADGAQDATATLARAVDFNRSVFIHTGQTCTSTSQNQSRCASRGSLQTGGLGVDCARRDTTDAQATYYCVVQFAPGILKFKRQLSQAFIGNIQTSDATIPAVVVNNTILFWGGYTNNGFQNDIISAELTSSTNVRFSGGQVTTSTARTAAATVAEFNPKFVLQAAQACGDQITGAATTQNKTVSAIVLANTLIHRTGFHTSTTASNYDAPTLYPTSTTNVRSQRGTSIVGVTCDTKGIAIGLRH